MVKIIEKGRHLNMNLKIRFADINDLESCVELDLHKTNLLQGIFSEVTMIQPITSVQFNKQYNSQNNFICRRGQRAMRQNGGK